MIIYARQGRYYIQEGSEEYSIPSGEIDFRDLGNRLQVTFDRWTPDNSRSKLEKYYPWNLVLDRYGNQHGSNFEEFHDSLHSGLDVNLQDQTTDVIIRKFSQVENQTTLASATAIGDYQINVSDPTGLAVGKYITLFNPNTVRFSSFYAVGVIASVVTLDSPLDVAYPAGTFVDVGITDMSVNGAGTPQVFGLRGAGQPEGVELTFDMTRIVITLLCTQAPAYDLFGDLARLTNGIVMRTRNDRYFNIFNVKTNGEWAGMMYDLSAADKVNPSQGQNGWIGRMTFAGQNKMGVAIRLPVGEDAEFIIQDDLSGLDLFEVVAEGHITIK